MKNLIAMIFALSSTCCFAVTEYILHWQIEDTNIYDNNNNVVGNVSDMTYARLIATVDGTSIIANQINITDDSIFIGMIKYHGIHEDGTEIPVSKLSDNNLYAKLAAFNPQKSAEYWFAVELGNFENGKWVTEAVATSSYNSLNGSITVEEISSFFGIDFIRNRNWHDVPQYSGWRFHSVPEPSTSLLCIIGLGVLMLKRKPCHG